MISTCPHCGRAVANDERIGYSRIGWMPTSCMAGDGPAACYDGEREIVTNNLHFYTSVRDGNQQAMLTGPHPDYDTARADLDRAKAIARKADPWSDFMSYGLASSNVRFTTYEERLPKIDDVPPAETKPRRKRKAARTNH